MIIVGLATAGAGWFIFSYLRADRSMNTMLSSREELSNDQIYERYYGHSNLAKESVLRSWHEIAETLKLPAGKLRPDDRFGEQLIGRYPTDNELDALSDIVASHFRAASLEPNIDLIKTVDDYIKAIAPILGKR
jgi:hypothetical protein